MMKRFDYIVHAGRERMDAGVIQAASHWHALQSLSKSWLGKEARPHPGADRALQIELMEIRD